MTDLDKKKCVPCEGGLDPLSKNEAEKQFSSKTKSDQLKVRELWKNFYPSYFQSHPPGVIKEHSLVITKRKSDTTVKVFPKNETFNTDSLLVYTKDRLNVFRTIIGELDSQNINVLEASLYGTKNGYCLDHIIISDHKGDPLQLTKDQTLVFLGIMFVLIKLLSLTQ